MVGCDLGCLILTHRQLGGLQAGPITFVSSQLLITEVILT